MAIVLFPGLHPDFISWLWSKISLKKSMGTIKAIASYWKSQNRSFGESEYD